MNGRRARERHRHEHDGRHEHGGSGIITPSRAELRAALDRLPPDLPWPELRDALRSVFLRRRPLPPGMSAPLVRRLSPGVDVALGADIGPALLYVSQLLLDSWSVGTDEAFDIALHNLRRVIDAERYFEVAYEPVDGVPVWWYQSHGGLASGLLLLEDILVARYGDQPRVLMAPMRNLLLSAPYDADRDLLEWLRDEVARADPNGLDLPLFSLVGGRLKIEPPVAGRRAAPVH